MLKLFFKFLLRIILIFHDTPLLGLIYFSYISVTHLNSLQAHSTQIVFILVSQNLRKQILLNCVTHFWRAVSKETA